MKLVILVFFLFEALINGCSEEPITKRTTANPSAIAMKRDVRPTPAPTKGAK